MNFFEAQEKARKDTWRLVILFLLAVVGLIAITTLFVSYFCIEYISHDASPVRLEKYLDTRIAFSTGFGVLLTVALGTLFQYFSLSKGGKNVALALGGKPLSAVTANLDERKVLNVVEEMAIASGIITPTIYLLENDSINAFAAGMAMDDAVIGITRGAIERLNRDELQGVIAHEYSHIFNGDMRLNMHLAAILYGILLIGMIGEFIMRGSRYKRSSSDSKNGGSQLIFLGLGLFIIGYIGVFFGSLIKASVSRKREFLADATAVQYTRFPAGIAGALKKILYYQSSISSPSASTYSHFYFAKGVTSLFATHPPLEERIRRVDPKWDGVIPEYANNPPMNTDTPKVVSQEKQQTFIQGAVAAAVLSTGSMGESEVEKVHEEIIALDKKVQERLNDLLGAQAALLVLFYDEAHKDELFASVRKYNPNILLEFANLLLTDVSVYKQNILLVIPIALYTLKSLSKEQFEQFNSLVKVFVDIDHKVSMYEWSLRYIIQRNLQIYFGERDVPKRMVHTHLGAIKHELEVFFSMLMYNQYTSNEAAKKAFVRVMNKIGAGALEYQHSDDVSHEIFEKAMKEIELAKPGVNKRIFEGVLHAVESDGEVTREEALFLHAMAQLLQVPLPKKSKYGER